MDTKYMAKVWATETLSKEAEKQLDIMIEALLPNNYKMQIIEGSFENPDNQYQAKYGFQAKLIPNTDSPHWVVNAYSKAGVKARVLTELLDGRPVYPLTK